MEQQTVEFQEYPENQILVWVSWVAAVASYPEYRYRKVSCESPINQKEVLMRIHNRTAPDDSQQRRCYSDLLTEDFLTQSTRNDGDSYLSGSIRLI